MSARKQSRRNPVVSRRYPGAPDFVIEKTDQVESSGTLVGLRWIDRSNESRWWEIYNMGSPPHRRLQSPSGEILIEEQFKPKVASIKDIPDSRLRNIGIESAMVLDKMLLRWKQIERLIKAERRRRRR